MMSFLTNKSKASLLLDLVCLQVRLVGGKIVRSAVTGGGGGSPRVARKQSTETAAVMASGAAVMTATAEERPKLVRRRTWTKEELEMARVEGRRLEDQFEGARKITGEEYQAGERFAVQRQEDHLRLGMEVRPGWRQANINL